MTRHRASKAAGNATGKGEPARGEGEGQCSLRVSTRIGSTGSRRCGSGLRNGCPAAWCRTRPGRGTQRQIDDLVEAATDADATGSSHRRTAAWPHWWASARRRRKQFGDTLDLARGRAVRREGQLRTHRRGRRSVLHLPAREDRRLPRRAEAEAAVRGRRGAPVRPDRAPTGSTSSIAARCCATPSATGSLPTGGCSVTAGPRCRAEPAQHRLPHAVRAFRQPGHAVLARQADLATSSASGPSIPASARSPSSGAPGLTCATT